MANKKLTIQEVNKRLEEKGSDFRIADTQEWKGSKSKYIFECVKCGNLVKFSGQSLLYKEGYDECFNCNEDAQFNYRLNRLISNYRGFKKGMEELSITEVELDEIIETRRQLRVI